MPDARLTLLGVPVPRGWVEVMASADDRQGWPLARAMARHMLTPRPPFRAIDPAHLPRRTLR